jgi:hypothetical protein
MPYQLKLDEFWREPAPPKHYQDTDMLYCDTHEYYAPNAFYDEREIDEMIRETGRVECPYCMMEIAGFS